MNLVFFGIIIFILVFVLLSWFTKTSSKKVAKGARVLIFILSAILAVLFVIAGRFLFSLPLLLLAMSVLKIKGLSAIQIFQLWRLLQYLRNAGRFSYYGQSNQAQPSSNLSVEEAYKIYPTPEAEKVISSLSALSALIASKVIVIDSSSFTDTSDNAVNTGGAFWGVPHLFS